MLPSGSVLWSQDTLKLFFVFSLILILSGAEGSPCVRVLTSIDAVELPYPVLSLALSATWYEVFASRLVKVCVC